VFAQEGGHVVLVDINLEAAQKAAKLVAERFPHAKAVATRADVSKEADIKAAVDLAVKEFGRLDVMVRSCNSAALSAGATHVIHSSTTPVGNLFVDHPAHAHSLSSKGIMHPDDDNALNTEERIWDLTMNINLKGVWWGCKYAILAMRNNPADETKGLRTGGSIINTASFVALMGAATPQLAYTASKVCRFSYRLWASYANALRLGRSLGHDARAGYGPRPRRHPYQLDLPVSIPYSLRGQDRADYIRSGPLKTRACRDLYIPIVHIANPSSALLMDFLNTAEKRDRRMVHLPMGRFGEAIEVAKGALFRTFTLARIQARQFLTIFLHQLQATTAAT
jgi:NAD(P)-dependent dehydrogenase (short-subunit alcohol dehydrogenase family)